MTENSILIRDTDAYTAAEYFSISLRAQECQLRMYTLNFFIQPEILILNKQKKELLFDGIIPILEKFTFPVNS